jgi:hypothetical protein
MATEVAIILDNVGNDIYAQASREFLTNPVRVDLMKILLNNASQISDIIKIRNYKSFGSESNRDISLRQYISAMDKTNLIIEVPLNPPLILDGQTYFQLVIEANTEVDFLFYYDQVELSSLLK